MAIIKFSLSGLILLFLSTLSLATPLSKRGPDDDPAAKALENAYKVLNGTLSDRSAKTICTKETLAVRNGDLTNDEKDDYVKAVKCLLAAPSKLGATQYPGAKSRYDDFVVVHINMTMGVHDTANFLHWHRYYIWAYEVAVRSECGYNGYQPYWNWGKYPDPTVSPIFNGDAHSMGGNRESVTYKGYALGVAGIMVPPWKGGGCVKTGPFVNMTVNLGLIAGSVDAALKIPTYPDAHRASLGTNSCALLLNTRKEGESKAGSARLIDGEDTRRQELEIAAKVIQEFLEEKKTAVIVEPFDVMTTSRVHSLHYDDNVTPGARAARFPFIMRP